MRIGAPDATRRPEVVWSTPIIRADLAAIAGAEHHVDFRLPDLLDPMDEWVRRYAAWSKIFCIFTQMGSFGAAVVDRPRVHQDPGAAERTVCAEPLDVVQEFMEHRF